MPSLPTKSHPQEEKTCPGRARGAAPDALTAAYPPILKILVPQTGHVPVVAGLLFFITMRWGFWISLFALHFTQ